MLNRKKRIAFTIITIGCSISLSIWIANTILRKVEKYREQKHLGYSDVVRKDGLGPGGLLKEGFDDLVHDGCGGAVRWKNNNQGFREDKDVSQKPLPGVLRILSLGDSFTAGHRIDQAATYSKLLERWSTENLGPTEILISMIEHPDRGLEYLREYGYTWSPHIVMLGITLGNDIAHSYIARHPTPIGLRNGLETLYIPDRCFVEHNLVERIFRKGVYHLSYSTLSRALFGLPEEMSCMRGPGTNLRLFDSTSGFGMYIKDPPQEINDAYQRVSDILVDYKTFCGEHNITFVVLLFPQRFQVQPHDWQTNAAAYNLEPETFDLMQPNKRIGDFCLSESIPCIDPTEAMKKHHLEGGENLYLPGGDMHWNRHGNRAWFLGARAELEAILQKTLMEMGSDP